MFKRGFSYLLIGLFFSFIFSACTSAKDESSKQKNNPPVAKEEEIKGKFSFKTLLVEGKNLVCTYSYQDFENETNVSGTTYLAGGKMFQDTITTSKSNEGVKTNTLFLDNTIYSWNPEDKTQGMKIKIDPKSQEQVKTDVAGTQENMEKEYDLDCKPWDSNGDVFKVPEDITFRDLAEMMNNLPNIPSLPSLSQ